MRKLILFFLLFLIFDVSSAQIKHRALNTNVYTGIGYKFVYLTSPDANNAYPFFQLSSGDFLKEIDGFLGVILNESYGIEFSPSYLFTNSVSGDGFYYGTGTSRRFYVPAQARLVAVPVNLRFKFYPFAKNYSSSLSKMYLGIGGGMMYFDEEITSQIYLDEGVFNYLGTRTAQGSFWTNNFEFLAGVGSFSKIGFGFELSYRIVPLKDSQSGALITSIASNFNSINLAANIIFSF